MKRISIFISLLLAMAFSCACSHSEDMELPIEEPSVANSATVISFENLGAPIDSIADLSGTVLRECRNDQRWYIGHHIPETIDCVDMYFPAEFPEEFLTEGLRVVISGVVYKADDINVNMGGYTPYKIKLTKIERAQ